MPSLLCKTIKACMHFAWFGVYGTGSLNGSVSMFCSYWLSICSLPKPNQAGSHSCPSSAAVCMKSVDHRDADFTLGKLTSQKIKVTSKCPSSLGFACQYDWSLVLVAEPLFCGSCTDVCRKTGSSNFLEPTFSMCLFSSRHPKRCV